MTKYRLLEEKKKGKERKKNPSIIVFIFIFISSPFLSLTNNNSFSFVTYRDLKKILKKNRGTRRARVLMYVIYIRIQDYKSMYA